MKLLIFLCLVFWPKVFAAPLSTHESGGVEHIVLIDSNHPTPPKVIDILQRLELSETHPDVKHIYNNTAFQGFAASMKPHCLSKLSKMTDVSIVEETSNISTASILVPTSGAFNTRGSAPWGLQRISTASSAVGGNAANLDFTYSFANNKLGAGVDIYIIDTGVYTQNAVFDGRARMYWTFNGNTTDNDGHGTHVSGIAAGNILGVASAANIFGVKALDIDGSGSTATVIKAIDITIQCHEARKGTANYTGAVMSLSLASSGKVQSLNQAVNAATKAGVHAVVAAGNNGGDACQISPAGAGGTHGSAIGVGAIDIDSKKASFSNFGECVDVYAPGVNVISSWIGGVNEVKSLSGTSMATPHVTGIVAYAMANSTLAGSPALMKEWVRGTAVRVGREGILLANNGVQALSVISSLPPGNNVTSHGRGQDGQDGDCQDD